MTLLWVTAILFLAIPVLWNWWQHRRKTYLKGFTTEDSPTGKLHVAVLEYTQGDKTWEERLYSDTGIVWRDRNGYFSYDTSRWLEDAFKAPLGRREYKAP